MQCRKIYRYDVFGNLLNETGDIANRLTYTGQIYDGATIQYYLRARFYNPVIGRFMQEDTYRGDGLNLYAYCANNPVIYYDLRGYSNQQDWLNNLPNMTYEERLEALYSRSDQLFQQKVDTGSIHYSCSGLLPGELDAVLGMDVVSGDSMSPHHIPSTHSILKELGDSMGHVLI